MQQLELQFDEPIYNMTYSFEDFASDCYLFNELAGKDKQCSYKDIYQQSLLINEEVNEILCGVTDNNPEEVLDGCIDVLVVTLGLMQKLEQLGVDVSKAMQKTAMNNFSKFPSDFMIAQESVVELKRKGVECRAEYNADYELYVIKDANDKVRKPLDFVSNDLLDCIPEVLQQDGFEKE
jgi:hypothetical protein